MSGATELVEMAATRGRDCAGRACQRRRYGLDAGRRMLPDLAIRPPVGGRPI